MKKHHKILVMRTDRMGDVMLALPSLLYLREQLPQAQIDFLVQDLYVDVIGPYLDSIGVRTLGLGKEGQRLFQRNYTALLTLFASPKLIVQAWRAKIPVRVGLLSKPWSFFLFSNALRQRRSLSEKNEALYNLELTRFFLKQLEGVAPESLEPRISLVADENSQQEALERLRDIGVKEGTRFVLFHPGMGGSAVNPSAEKYLQMIDTVEEKKHFPVVLSIGPLVRDQELASQILQRKPYLKVIRYVELPVLREVFRLAETVVAPSTGPLHLAHYVGTNTVGIYPPVRAQERKRWAPWGGSGKSATFAPNLGCPGERTCIGKECPHFFCMDQIDWADLILGKESSLN